MTAKGTDNPDPERREAAEAGQRKRQGNGPRRPPCRPSGATAAREAAVRKPTPDLRFQAPPPAPRERGPARNQARAQASLLRPPRGPTHPSWPSAPLSGPCSRQASASSAPSGTRAGRSPRSRGPIPGLRTSGSAWECRGLRRPGSYSRSRSSAGFSSPPAHVRRAAPPRLCAGAVLTCRPRFQDPKWWEGSRAASPDRKSRGGV